MMTTPIQLKAIKFSHKVQKLLTEMPDTQPGEVAIRCGYSGTRQLNAHFRSELGMTAREFTKAEL